MSIFVIAVDGTAASGKGTIARRLAEHYNLAYLDTGTNYRAVAAKLLHLGASLEDEEAIMEVARSIDFNNLEGQELHSAQVGNAAGKIAPLPQLREILVARQREFIANSAKRAQNAVPDGFQGVVNGAILDGRDIGSVVYPEANVKFYIDADINIRAHRRLLQLYPNITSEDDQLYCQKLNQLINDLKIRDERDKNRPYGALTLLPDAHFLDNSNLSLEKTLEYACKIIDPIFNSCSKT